MDFNKFVAQRLLYTVDPTELRFATLKNSLITQTKTIMLTFEVLHQVTCKSFKYIDISYVNIP
jgi:hypothetical protein